MELVLGCGLAVGTVLIVGILGVIAHDRIKYRNGIHLHMFVGKDRIFFYSND
jgi:hypothetical protein